MTKSKKYSKSESQKVEQYTHDEKKRKNNPPVGLVTPGTDPDKPSKKYSFDPRLDPQLRWSGKQENSEFDVDTVSLHVHERIDPITILEKAMKPKQTTQETLFNYFDTPENNPPLRNAIEFYKHDQNWSNRLIAGDSLLVMNSLLEKEGMAGKIQMIYMDPPYGIKYGSNFQPFINKTLVKDRKDEDLTQEPETIKAFRDTWELGIHSYLTYLRDRLLLSKKLLHVTGSIFVQINQENLHYVKDILAEIFGTKNFVSIITFAKTTGLSSKLLTSNSDYIIWYANHKSSIKFHDLYLRKKPGNVGGEIYQWHELENGKIINCRNSKTNNIDNDKIFAYTSLNSESNPKFKFKFKDELFEQPWKTTKQGLENLTKAERIIKKGKSLAYKRYLDDFPFLQLTNTWTDTGASFQTKIYAVQTNSKAIERCMLMTTDPGDIILDPTSGSGTTVYVAEQWGRRWITCDTSRIAVALTKQRLMTSQFDYYQLNNPHEGISSGIDYKTVPHITLSSIANNEPPKNEVIYDQPVIEKNKTRISGPFTVEAVPAPTVKSLDNLYEESKINIQDRMFHQAQWRDELLKTGIKGKAGQKIEFSRVETHPATKWLHADAETKEDKPKRVMVSFGPEYAPLEQRQVALAIEEAQNLVPKPRIIIFAAMQFDPEAAKDIDEINWPDVTILKVEMNKDLLTKDLKKKRSSNESFWLMGQPDVELQKTKDKKYIITINGFDYYNTRTGEVESGNSSKIAMWMLDEDYDGRSVYPQQVFFPMKESTGGWHKLAKTLQAQIDEDLITKYQGTESIPFEMGPNKRAAVKIIDDRGIESLKIIDLE